MLDETSDTYVLNCAEYLHHVEHVR